MAFNKFNRLHLHASDAQSWPLEVPTLPDLASRGAYHTSQILSAADLRTVQSYAASLGIEVYIEIDMPGHMASVGCAYPDIIASWNKQPWGNYSAQPPSGQLRLDAERAYGFIDALLGDLLPRVSPFSSYFHLGGDELYPAAYGWTIDETRHHLQRFLNHTISKVKEHGLAPIVWEELLLDYNLTLPSDLIVQTWRSNSSKPASQVPIAEVTDRGYQALFGANDYWYLDCGHGTWLDPDPQNPKSPIKKPFLDYCGPFHNWRHVYTYEPLVNIPDSKRHLVVGGEACMWTEQTDEVNLDANVWPRLAAAGEVLWHRPMASITEEVTRRLSLMREWLVRKGVAAPPVQVTWCLMNQGSCLA